MGKMVSDTNYSYHAAMAQSKKTLYQILGVGRDASLEDIGLAHEMRAAELERRSPPDPSTQALVQQAFEILSNPKRRAAYDSQLLTAAEKSAAPSRRLPTSSSATTSPRSPRCR
jgi:curved DNA-binding protein CbpA